jgi:RecA-family ATPase
MATEPGASATQAWNAFTVAFIGGTFDTRIETGEDYATRTLAEIFGMAPACEDKLAGPAFIPSCYHDFDARSHTAQRERGSFVALTADIDSGDHSPGVVQKAVAAFVGDSAYLIYSSPHSRPGDRRWRVMVPLSEAAPFEAWYDAQTALFAFLGARGIETDRALARAGQLVFLPNVPAVHEKTGTPLRDNDGAPLYFQRHATSLGKPGLDLSAGPVAEGMAEIRRRRAEDERARERMRQEAEKRRANRPQGEETSLIDDFNAANSVATMLELCGYTQSDRDPRDWKSPNQTGETFATRVMGDKWFSLSQSDVAARVGHACDAGCFGDAYDLYAHYKHGGDHKSAYRELGAERRASNVVHPPQFNPPEWMTEIPPPQEPPDWMEAVEAVDHGEPSGEPPETPLLPLIDVANWIGKEPPKRLFAWGDNIPLNTTTMLTGPGGVGKSLFEQMLCTCIALGLPFLGVETRQMNTLYVTCEDDEEELWRRQSAICAALNVPYEAIIGKLHLVSLCGAESTALATFDESEQIVITERWRQLVRTCEDMQIQLYAFDNATDAMAGDLNSIHQVAEFVNLLTGLAIRMQGAAMILHHPNKAGDDWLGSVAWHNKVRSRLMISRSDLDGDPDGRILENPKANYGPSGTKIHFRWYRGAFVRDEDVPEDAPESIDSAIQATGDNKLFLACLQERNRQKRAVSESRYGRNYAPKVFATMPESKRIGVERLEQAMDRLFRIEAIERGFLWVQKGEGRAIHGIREVRKETKSVSEKLPAKLPQSSEGEGQ